MVTDHVKAVCSHPLGFCYTWIVFDFHIVFGIFDFLCASLLMFMIGFLVVFTVSVVVMVKLDRSLWL